MLIIKNISNVNNNSIINNNNNNNKKGAVFINVTISTHTIKTMYIHFS
jgi:hypothetical protein